MAGWSAREKNQLRRLVAEGAGVEDAAGEIGRPYGGVQWMARRLGLKFRRYGRPDRCKRLQLLDLLRAGLSQRQAAIRLRLAASTVCNKVARMRRDGML